MICFTVTVFISQPSPVHCFLIPLVVAASFLMHLRNVLYIGTCWHRYLCKYLQIWLCLTWPSVYFGYTSGLYFECFVNACIERAYCLGPNLLISTCKPANTWQRRTHYWDVLCISLCVFKTEELLSPSCFLDTSLETLWHPQWPLSFH